MANAAPKPSGRKRGRPRTVTDDQEVPEVGQATQLSGAMLTVLYKTETPATAPPRTASISQAQRDHNR